MAIDREKYIGKYIEEGLENITLVEALIFDLKEGISIEDDLATLLRALHTLKGSSRMLTFKRIEELCHSLENVFVAFREQRIGLSEKAVGLALSTLDLFKSGFNVIKEKKEDAIDIQEHVKNLNLLALNEEFSVVKNENIESANVPATEKNAEAEPNENKKAVEPNTKESKKESKQDSIRISIEKINEIIKSIASLQSLEISAKNISQESAELNSLIRDFSKTIKEQVPAFAANFRKIERLSGRLNSSVKNFTIDAGNSIRRSYDNVISLRTLPLSIIFDSYPRYVYELSNELGKKVQFSIEGKENKIDKNIIEGLSDVFMHMVRNSIDHGIETPQERIAAGKSETGKLSIVCTRESGSMKIVISDDGRGIEHEKIRQKAVKDGYIAETAAAQLSIEELTNFIFTSGFSTSNKTDNISGRGVGMDVVRETIESLKGSIFVESAAGKGTSFTIMVPLSIVGLMGFPVECGGMKFIIPVNFVETILLVNRADIITVVDRPEIKYNDRVIKLYYLSQILNTKVEAAKQPEVIFVVIVRSYEDIAAIAVDNINSMRTVFLKAMPAFMENFPVISGIVLNEDYEMLCVLHIPSIIKMAKRIKTIDIKRRSIEFEKLRKSILVVDDSVPTREIESEIFSSEGYMVDTAGDGAQALKAVKSKHYDLICTDINMPVMDGFMLIENLKKAKEFSKIPIIVVSSNTNEADKKRAYSLGASMYLTKNSFNNQNLLAAVNGLTGGNNE